jgi:hypothetical protein
LPQPIVIILLLGSYDPKTKPILENLKEEIIKNFSGENVYALLLDIVEEYLADDLEILTELINEDKVTLFIFQHNQLTDVNDIKLEGELDPTVYNFLKQKYNIEKINKLPIFEKFDILMQIAKTIFLIRHKEETRGGEYLELMHALFRGHSEKMWFFKRNSIELSAMLMEYLDKFKVKMRTYRKEQDLTTALTRILKFETQNS